MMTGSRRFLTIIMLGFLAIGPSSGVAEEGKSTQFRNHENSALGRYISSKSEVVKTITGWRVPVRELYDTNKINVWSPAERRIIQNGVLSDTLSLLSDVVSEIWDDIGSFWMNQEHTSHSYDPEGRRVQTVNQMWLMNSWQNTSQINYQFDGIGILRKVVGRSWNGGGWVDNTSDTIYYDTFGRVVQEHIRMFNGSSWQNFTNFSFSYDSSGMLTGQRRESWTGSEWQNVENYLLSYTAAGKISKLVYQVWSGTEWTNNLLDSFSYDGSENQVGELNQYWSGGTWNDDTRYTSTFDLDDFLIEVVEQLWMTSAWVNESKQIFNNDMDGTATDILFMYWDGVYWSNDGILYRTYDGPNIVEDYYTEWTGSTWLGTFKASYAWRTVITPNEATQKYPVSSAWNLVSVALEVPDYSKSALFPSAASSAFYFDAGYSAAAVLENGKGYWLKFDSSQAIAMTGTLRMDDTIEVSAGWNLVGSLCVTIAASGVGSIPGGLVVSSFFGFDAAYQASAIIEPGRAYWVKVAEAGKLVMSSSSNIPGSARVRIEPTDERPPAPPEEPALAAAVPLFNKLEQNYPNPFNPVTEIRFKLRDEGHVRLSVYNVIGHEVALLVDGVMEAGSQTVSFDGGKFPSGVYFYKISTGAFSNMRRMILLK